MVRWLATAGLLTLALLGFALSIQQANLALATQAIDHWKARPEPATAAAIDRYLSRANQIPDPDARFQSGRWLAMQGPHSSPEEALAQLRAAAAMRPAWYRPWTAMAVLLARSAPDGQAWQNAAREALVRGPNESRVFVTLFPLWRLHWHFLATEQRQTVHELTLTTAWREPALVVDLAQRYGYLAPVCRDGQDNRLVRLRCDKLGWTQSDLSEHL